MKKLLTILLSLAMISSLVSCGPKEEPEETPAPVAGPIEPNPGSLTIGDYTLTAEYLPFEEHFEVQDDPDMAVLGDTVYVSDGDSIVKVYTLSDSGLTYVKTLDIDNDDDGIEVDGNGNIYAKGGVFAAKIYDAEGNEKGEAAASGEIAVSKTEDFALTCFPGNDEVTKISGGASEPWVITGMTSGNGLFSTVNVMSIQDNHALIGGADSDKNLMAAYDTAGNQIVVSKDPLKGSLPNAICETANGYICTAVDDINLIAPDGTLIGSDDDSETLFGVEGTFWIRNLTPLADGSVLLCASVSGNGPEEALIFRLTGF